MFERAGLWPMRVVWLLLPVAVAAGFGEALDPHRAPVRTTALVLAWAAWAATLLALLIPRSIGLTLLRLVAPAGVAVGAWIAIDGEVSTTARALALTATLAAALVAALPTTAERLVDGSSYGDEHRVLLRVPAALWFGPLPIAWALLGAAVVGGPLLLAAGQWVVGIVVVGAAGLAGRAIVLRLHQLSRRWLVFVPAGVVVHDPLTLADPVLFPRRMIANLGPAPIDTTALDLTGGAVGLALELTTSEPVVVTPVRGRGPLTEVGVESVLVTPSRPGHTLRLADRRRLTVG